ncbi:ABC transporter ATP-binding protein [Denitratisoma oestradiolicum]|uniref:Spermidine/putrescine import ATP-binding protein PotA n=1 Tax=Denitratisoma oestradiolicum TaxID=311182 RepID=A0A6S6XT46_9PROT|nr:ABC transporter ATP-binding protein [Denitratisoma oestradiolicum]CAB1367333.1 putrescine transporter subunit: ATP-binding component of ABC superfamily [Denitratisoma oestradiolicum]
MALLELRNVTRRFGSLEAVKEVSLAVEAGEFFTLLGPSGCGKTTILRMIAGFDAPDQGDILLDGLSLSGVPPEQRPLHTVFQSYALFPHMSVAGNVAFPLEMAGRSRDEIKRRVAETLALVHLEDKGSAYPHELSGGQKQRVALARGLVNKPRLLLLDEPLGALDAKLREEMQIELIALQREVGVTFIFVTHSQQEALALSHRIAVMRESRIEQLDEPDQLYTQPANRFVADFIGKINLIEVEIIAASKLRLSLRAAGLGEIAATDPRPLQAGERGAFALRPELIRVYGSKEAADLKNRFEGHVRELLYLGDVTLYKVELTNGVRIEALMPNAAPGRAKFHEVGDPVSVCWRHDAGVYLRN